VELMLHPRGGKKWTTTIRPADEEKSRKKVRGEHLKKQDRSAKKPGGKGKGQTLRDKITPGAFSIFWGDK